MTKKQSFLSIALVVLLLLLAGCATDEVEETPVAPTATIVTSPTPAPPSLEDQPTPEAADISELVVVALQHVVRPKNDTLAVVNGQEITWADYEPVLRQAIYSITKQYGVDWSDSATQQRLGPLQDQVLEQTVERWLLRQLAEGEGVTIDEAEVTARVEQEKSKVLADGRYSDWETFLQMNGFTQESLSLMIHDTLLLSAFIAAQEVDTMAQQVHISHIVVGDEVEAREILARAKAGEDFSNLAIQYSVDPDAAQDRGDKGWFTRDMMEPSVADVVFAMEPGEISDPIGTPNGYAIILLMEREMRELDQRGLAQRQQQAVMAKLESMRTEAEIEYLVNFASETGNDSE